MDVIIGRYNTARVNVRRLSLTQVSAVIMAIRNSEVLQALVHYIREMGG